VKSAAGLVPQVGTELRSNDKLGALMVRLNIRRMNYAIEPGLYAVGNPDAESNVFVSANYKFSFDVLRKELSGINAWIMVLDTKGINVWCAAGKGTFGTEEMIKRVKKTLLSEVVSHRTLIVPQLGAPGTAAHTVKKESGFEVIYGPVYAGDIKKFLEQDMTSNEEMRKIHFNVDERLAVVPVELVQQGRNAILLIAAMILLAGLSSSGYSLDLALQSGKRIIFFILAAFLGGGVAAPLLLPYLPGKSFSFKGFFVGAAAVLLSAVFGLLHFQNSGTTLETAGWALLMPAIAAFLTMTYTGASTYTSLSGVQKEMRYAVPIEGIAFVVGAGLWIGSRFYI
jgi:acetyl-CoA decarbonylase/synthase complex subunit gamma